MSRLWRRGLPGPTGRGPPWACRSVSGRVAGSRPGGRPHFLCGQEMGERSRRGLGRPARAAPGARYARRPLAGAPPRDPGLSPLRGPGPVGRILYKDGLRPNLLDPRAASSWPSAKVGGTLPRMNGRVYSNPPAAAPRAQCLCRRVSGTVSVVPIGEARPLLRGAQRPRGGGKLRGFAAHARKARERPERALFSAGRFCRAFRQPLLGERNLPYQKRPSSRTASFL